MKIFGLNFTTKKELKRTISELEETIITYKEALETYEENFAYIEEDFPFDLGEVVYDVALKNEKGRYTKTNPSFAYSTITAVTVDEKNYFSLVKRLKRKDVFFEPTEAEEYLRAICK